jgi:hypothetical protein
MSGAVNACDAVNKKVISFRTDVCWGGEKAKIGDRGANPCLVNSLRTAGFSEPGITVTCRFPDKGAKTREHARNRSAETFANLKFVIPSGHCRAAAGPLDIKSAADEWTLAQTEIIPN